MSGSRISSANVVVLAAGMVSAAALITLAPVPDPRPPAEVAVPSLLDAFPAGAAFVLTVDLERVRRTQLGAALAGNGREIPGLGPLEELCGFDPTSAALELAFVVPAAARPAGLDENAISDLGVAASGRFDEIRLVRCVETVVRARGGMPVSTAIGGFTAVRDGSGRAEGVVAVREGGPVLLGGARYLREMIATLEGSGRSLGVDTAHATMRQEVGVGAAAVASWAMAPTWLVDVTGSELARMSPLASVRTLAVRADFEHGLDLTASLGCPDPDTCRDVAEQLASLKRDLSPDAARAFGMDVLARIHTTTSERHVRLSLKLDERQASDMLEHALTQLKLLQAPGTAGPDATPEASGGPPPRERFVAPR